MARKTLISPAVIGSDAFLELPIDVRELYFHLLVEADPIGTVANAMQVTRGCGHDEPKRLLDTLADAGYLVEAEARDGGRIYFISHWFEHNRHDKKREGTSAYLDVADRLLDDPYAPYRKRVDGKASTIDENVSTIDAQCNATQCNATQDNAPHLNSREMGKGSLRGKPDTASCPKCGAPIIEADTVKGFSHISCVRCNLDTWINPETGEARTDPYVPVSKL